MSMFDHSILCVRHCKDVVTPLCLDARLPVDTLYMVFEEDYRFFPEGQDPDGIDDYKRRVIKKVVQRGVATLHGSSSSWRQGELAGGGVGGWGGVGGGGRSSCSRSHRRPALLDGGTSVAAPMRSSPNTTQPCSSLGCTLSLHQRCLPLVQPSC